MSPATRRSSLAVVAVVVIGLAAACTPKGNPKGALDSIRLDSSNRVVAEGWAFDPETPGSVLVEVRRGSTVLASQRTGSPKRDDVAAAFPGQATRDSGYAITTPALSSGAQEICVWARNKGVGTGDTNLGCQTFGHGVAFSSFALVGDSLGVGVDSPLRSRVATRWPGSSFASRVQTGSPLSYAVAGIDQYKASTDVIVVSSGANNLLSSTIAADLRSALTSTAGASCVVWPTVSERIYGNPANPPNPAYGTAAQWKAGAQAFNAALRDEAGKRPNLHVADWAPTVTATSSYTGTDGLHHTASGNTAFATLLVDTIAANC